MASKLLLEGQYKVASNIIGKKDLKDYKIEFNYPLSVDFEETEEVSEALFYIKRFFLERTLRAHDKDFYGQYSCEIVDAIDLEEGEVKSLIESGELKAIDPDTLTANDIREFKHNDFIWALIMMDEDNTAFVSQNVSTFASRNKEEKVAVLIQLLGIEEQAEVKASKSKNRKTGILGKKAEAPKSKRPARKLTSERVEVEA